MPQLVYGNAKFAINMPGGNFVVAACHNVRVEADAYRVAIAIPGAKLLQYRDVVYVDIHAQTLWLHQSRKNQHS